LRVLLNHVSHTGLVGCCNVGDDSLPILGTFSLAAHV
jgi:hypothetical protein